MNFCFFKKYTKQRTTSRRSSIYLYIVRASWSKFDCFYTETIQSRTKKKTSRKSVNLKYTLYFQKTTQRILQKYKRIIYKYDYIYILYYIFDVRFYLFYSPFIYIFLFLCKELYYDIYIQMHANDLHSQLECINFIYAAIVSFLSLSLSQNINLHYYIFAQNPYTNKLL